MTGILIVTKTQDIVEKEIVICEKEDARDIMEGKYYMKLYEDKVVDYYLDEEFAYIKQADGTEFMIEIISNIWKY